MNNRQNRGNEGTPNAQATGGKVASIKLGLDVHADTIVVVRIIENSGPQPAQTFAPERFLEWVKAQQARAKEVHSCYEAGPFGYGLHRALVAMGVVNRVVQAVRLDERNTGVNNDKTDARELAMRLDRYVAGNVRALALVNVPSPEEEQRRVMSRQREQIQKELKRVAAQGRGLLLTQGYREKKQWWRGRRWEELEGKLPVWLKEALERFKRMLEAMEAEKVRIDGDLTREAGEERPKGMGPLTREVIDREVGNWDRFKNRRQIGSYTGLCGGVSSSGANRRQTSVTKHGNVRLRTALVEMAWRMVMYQPESRLVKKWNQVFGNPRATTGAKKKAIVAIGRQLAVDLWRWRTGRAKAEDFGWVMMEG
jgi:transposase